MQRITLRNFRQFADEQSFDLDSSSLKPVSLIFGANGSGKTTFLNAFSWALYGTLSDDVEQHHRLINDDAWREASMGDTVEVSVDLVFDHEGETYRILRSASVRKESDQQSVRGTSVKLEGWRTGSSGASEVLGSPQEMVSSILPQGVSRFFFFNGERIENLVKKSAYAEVQKDIKVLLGLEQVERALTHLPKVDRKLTAELRRYGGARASEIQDVIDAKQEEETQLAEEATLTARNIVALKEERDEVAGLLRKHADSAPIQTALDTVNRELEEARQSLEAAEAARSALVATRGFQAFTKALGDSTESMAEGLYEKGALPAPLKREFVDKLLADGVCICGAHLTADSEGSAHVREWRHRAGLQVVETSWQQLSGQLRPLASSRTELRESLTELFGRVGSEKDRLVRLQEQQGELTGQLKDSPAEDVQALQTKSMDLESRIANKQQRLGQITVQRQNLDREIEQKTRDRSKAAVEDELAEKARSRSDLVQSVTRALKEILSIREDDMRRRLDAELKAIFAKITHQNHQPILDEGFELRLEKEIDGVMLPVPKSTGENQILSLSFVTAVSQIARQIRTEARAEGASREGAGEYPIVMDAAFGSLDEDYQESVARALAEMAPQLVVLVSKSQGLGKVVEQLMPHVSHVGIIETHTTSDGDVADDVELRGNSYPYIVKSSRDRSELKEIQ
nr:AAA family ATPase [Microbacterium invictum]